MSSHTSEEDGKPGDAYRKPHGTGDTVANEACTEGDRACTDEVPGRRCRPYPSKYELIFAQLAIREQSDKENVKRREENKKKLDDDVKMMEDKNKEAAEEDEDDWEKVKYSEDEEDEEETGRSGA
ncbi:hypothetical protein HO173_005881 [Letharia columbiana]|uniref:Uncharacterized protein n=1 Tax=Letharia columbiana TaxID=112416 RepID=A0A8H6FWR7_9LECA|nr:uncharacterized protein HO173_005881 [Letharia columbiana]KAF6236250.1 hypothetical protein HO173_005881 [Letharia columbiana]